MSKVEAPEKEAVKVFTVRVWLKDAEPIVYYLRAGSKEELATQLLKAATEDGRLFGIDALDGNWFVIRGKYLAKAEIIEEQTEERFYARRT